MIRGVPYRSQWVSPECVRPILRGEMTPSQDPRWGEFGAASAAEYDFWSWRVCGLACLEMVLGVHGVAHGSTMELVRLAERYGAYQRHDHGVRGLVYEPFARMVGEQFGVGVSVRPELGVEELCAVVRQGSPTIASVHPSIREPSGPAGGRGGHLVLCVGADAADATDGADATDRVDIVFHNPSGDRPENQDHARVPATDFERFFAGRGLVFDPPPPCERERR